MALPLGTVLFAAGVFLGSPGLVAAQKLADPTRPPPEFLGARGDRAGDAIAVPGGGQVIILSSGRNQVTMGGRSASVGHKLGDATVLSITDAEVVTRNKGQLERTPLYGDIDKRITNAPSAASPAGVAKPGAGQ